ncbi:protein disulfide oxidoreductase [Uruburuella testudinis]|uniref:Protein disulfide oxidoreductase n=1 Tax=Uruburuella testudinis TaxID=1282863 RepID=A0ABY4DXC0_9NEIS|nr:protein disulfide oxidoreductase [Uruburuella testudinis]UOO83265.1 protein disulfide oxidoreductase [Uruburuella testudinis]
MHKRMVYWLKQIVQTVIILAVVAVAVDWWRQPVQPVGFTQTPWQTLQGERWTLAEFSSNRPVVVYFWGSWCGICRYTSPVVEKLHQAGVPVMGVALRSGSADEVAAYMRGHDYDFDTLNDADGKIAAQWQVAVTPTIAVIKNGNMVHHTTGLSSYWGLRSRIWLADWLY